MATVIAAGLVLFAGSLNRCTAQLAAVDEPSANALADLLSDADADGDGLSNWQEYLLGTTRATTTTARPRASTPSASAHTLAS